MLRVIFILVTYLINIVFASQAYASKQDLQNFFQSTKSFQSKFEQRVVDENGTVLGLESGQFYLSRPGKFRWNYNESEGIAGQQIIADGKSIILYDPDLEQATYRNYDDALGQVPSLLLVHSGVNIQNHFDIKEINLDDDLSWVSLTPKDTAAAYQELLIGFKSGNLTKIKLKDGLGIETLISFVGSTNVGNKLTQHDVFKFTPPQGTDVINQ